MTSLIVTHWRSRPAWRSRSIPPASDHDRVGRRGAIGTAHRGLGVLAFVTLIACKADRPWQRIGVRIAGSWIVASAILVLALRLTR